MALPSRYDADRASIIRFVNPKSTAIKAIHATFANANVRRCGNFFIKTRARCEVTDIGASRALTFPRQHFLKWEAVFLNVLVYSGCSASRFPSARSD
jgi:hypothetical protein